MIIVNITNDYTLLFIYARKNGYTDDTLKSFLKKKECRFINNLYFCTAKEEG